jgi:hypothetical protein
MGPETTIRRPLRCGGGLVAEYSDVKSCLAVVA